MMRGWSLGTITLRSQCAVAPMNERRALSESIEVPPCRQCAATQRAVSEGIEVPPVCCISVLFQRALSAIRVMHQSASSVCCISVLFQRALSALRVMHQSASLVCSTSVLHKWAMTRHLCTTRQHK
eukprot:1159152-Pelagomonas_calceolata.AAC.4